ncbi:MAG: thioesterase [Lutibacter sp.]|nr:MAG: thioesterase [Lutibacter sp.]
MNITVKKMKRFLMLKLPSAYLCGVRLREISNTKSVVTVRYKWINQNPFRSMYFAVQSMAAELTTGAMVIKKITKTGRKVSMLVITHKGSFTKKAVGLITFTCNDGNLIDEALKRTIETGEGQTVIMKSVGVNEQGEQVSVYEFEWSLKLKSKK